MRLPVTPYRSRKSRKPAIGCPVRLATVRRESKNKGEPSTLSRLVCISTGMASNVRPTISGTMSRLRRRVEIYGEAPPVSVLFSRKGSIADAIEARIRAATTSIDAALYRFGNPRLAKALCDAQRRGVAIRLIIDRGKFEYSEETRNLLSRVPFPFRLTHGRDGARSKMHHKFVILDGRTVLTGSYNWTLASEEQNYENLLILQAPRLVGLHRQEFESLWARVKEAPKPESQG